MPGFGGSSLLLGIDGGGSKTTALLASTDGDVIGRGAGGASNYQAVGLQTALAELEKAVRGAVTSAGPYGTSPIAAVCLGMAGVDRPEDRTAFSGWAAVRFPGAKVKLVSDAHLVLAAGAGTQAGVALISGTGSIAYAQDGRGNTARAGGWGYLLGDEGSGYRIALDGLRALTRAWDGMAPPTALTAYILDALGIQSPPELVRKLYREHMPRAEIARLAEVVLNCALSGDGIAVQLLNDAAANLAGIAAAAARKLALTGPLPCAMAGGLLTHSQILRDAVVTQARADGLEIAPVVVVQEPAVGAVALARELGG